MPASCAAVILFAYMPVLAGMRLIWDDWAWVVCVQSWSAHPLTLFTLDPSYSCRPVCRFLFLVLFEVFGFHTPAFGAVILGLHFLAALCVGALAARLLGDRRAGAWIAVLFAAASSHAEALQWIGAFPHVLLGLELFLLLGLLVSSPSRKSIAFIAGGLLFLTAVLTRELWVVLVPLTCVVFVWKHGIGKACTRGRTGLAVFFFLCAAAYLYACRDFLEGGRVPGGEGIFGPGPDMVPRVLRSLSQLFVPRCFYAHLLRNALGGTIILSVLLALAAGGGRRTFRHALFALLFLAAALFPYALYRSPFLCGRYLYLAGPGAVMLLFLAARGARDLLVRFLPFLRPRASLILAVPLMAWGGLSILGIRMEAAHRYGVAWHRSEAVERDLRKTMDRMAPGAWCCVFDLPRPNPATWGCMAQLLFPSCRSVFLQEESPAGLAERIRRTTAGEGDLLFLRWKEEADREGGLRPFRLEEPLEAWLVRKPPQAVWGYPRERAPRRWTALLVRRSP